MNQRVGCVDVFFRNQYRFLMSCERRNMWLNAIFSYKKQEMLVKVTLVQEKYLNLDIAIPPYREQHRIVVEIEKWFALIDQIEQGKSDFASTIKQTKSKILDLAIHGKLVPQDPNDERQANF